MFQFVGERLSPCVAPRFLVLRELIFHDSSCCLHRHLLLLANIAVSTNRDNFASNQIWQLFVFRGISGVVAMLAVFGFRCLLALAAFNDFRDYAPQDDILRGAPEAIKTVLSGISSSRTTAFARPLVDSLSQSMIICCLNGWACICPSFQIRRFGTTCEYFFTVNGRSDM